MSADIKEVLENPPFSGLKSGEFKARVDAIGEILLNGYKLTPILSDGKLLGKFGFVQKLKEHHHNVYTKIVECEVRGGVTITERAYVLEIRERTAQNDILATFDINGRNIFSAMMNCDYIRARHVAIKAAVAWCKKSWRNAGV